MQIVENHNDDICIYRVDGRLDSRSSPELDKRIENAISSGTTSMVLDFTKLEYISSAGLRVILKATKALKKSRGRIVLCALQDYVQEVFEISGFHEILPIAPSVEMALSELNPGGAQGADD